MGGGGGVCGSSERWSSRVSSAEEFMNKPKVLVREMDARRFMLILYAYFYC